MTVCTADFFAFCLTRSMKDDFPLFFDETGRFVSAVGFGILLLGVANRAKVCFFEVLDGLPPL